MLKSQGNMYGSAPTHVAVSNMATRLVRMSLDVAKKALDYDNQGDSSTSPPVPASQSAEDTIKEAYDVNAVGRRRPFVVRGFSLEDEVRVALMLLENPELAEDMDKVRQKIHKASGKWQFECSLAFWFLLCVGHHRVCISDDRPTGKLEPNDPLKVHMFKGDFVDKRQDLASFRKLGSCQIGWAGLLQEVPSVGSKISEVMQHMFKYGYVDIVFTTPALSEQAPYTSFRRQVNAVVIDETGNMHRSDFHAVRGNTLLPTLLMGDEKQLPPMVAAPKMRADDEFAVNRHWNDGAMSVLEFLKGNGVPIFRLNMQMRMANGLFDQALHLFYGEIEASGSFAYGPGCDISLPKFNNGCVLEKFLRDRFLNLKAPPSKKLWPVYLHCPGRPFTNPLTGSKRNVTQIYAVLNFLMDFVKETGVSTKSIRLLTPYGWNLETLDSILKQSRFKELKEGVDGGRTVDSFQGQEGDIIVYLTVSARSKNGLGGPGFIADEHRLNVAMTRQVSGLIIVGDINVAKPLATDDLQLLPPKAGKGGKGGKGKGGKDVKVINYNDDGTKSYTHSGKLIDLHTMMLKGGRVVALEDQSEPKKEEAGQRKRKREEDGEKEKAEDKAGAKK